MRQVPLASINTGSNRALSDNGFSELVDSIRALGVLQPPMLRQNNDGRFEIVFGRRRIAAAKKVGLSEIECIVVDLDELHREMAELDENLCRSPYSPAELALVLKKRKSLYEQCNGLAKARGANAANKKQGRANVKLAAAFTEDVAAKTGKSRRTVQRSIARADALGDTSLNQLRGTSLNSGVEMDALAQLPATERDALIARAVDGKKVSAVERLEEIKGAATEVAVPAGLDALQACWQRADVSAKRSFLEWVRADAPDLIRKVFSIEDNEQTPPASAA
jgi:hypothetical protein